MPRSGERHFIHSMSHNTLQIFSQKYFNVHKNDPLFVICVGHRVKPKYCITHHNSKILFFFVAGERDPAVRDQRHQRQEAADSASHRVCGVRGAARHDKADPAIRPRACE